MPSRCKVPFFEPYFLKLELDACKREAEEDDSLRRQLLDAVVREQQCRLSAIREVGTWDAEHSGFQRQLTERAYETLVRLKRFRQAQERIADLERELPPETGLGRLRYANPWILVYGLAATAVAMNVVAWFR